MPIDRKYGWIDDLTEEIKQGDHLKVKVLEIDKEEKKVVVSAKATQTGHPDFYARNKWNSHCWSE